jgi:peptide/nickel transport system permease protein
MTGFAIKRILKGVFIVWCIWTIVFFLVRLTGDPTDWLVEDGASTTYVEQLRQQLHVDEPLHIQYIESIKDLLSGNLGYSRQYKKDVVLLYKERLPQTLKLALPSLLLGAVFGVTLGTVAAIHHDSFADKTVRIVTVVFHTLPNFCLGILMILFFSLTLRWFPSAGSGSWKSYIMPMLTLASGPTATIARLTRNSLVNTMTNEYIDGARMKGVKEIDVIIRHGLRNSLAPVVTRIGMQIGTIIGGSAVVENVFSWPGMGQLLVTAAKNRDFQVVQLGVLIIASTVTIAHILIDLSHGWLDPRVREQVK